VRVAEIRGGLVTLVDLLKINALLDAREAAEAHAMEQAKRGGK
jgi:hypothetical protein